MPYVKTCDSLSLHLYLYLYICIFIIETEGTRKSVVDLILRCNIVVLGLIYQRLNIRIMFVRRKV